MGGVIAVCLLLAASPFVACLVAFAWHFGTMTGRQAGVLHAVRMYERDMERRRAEARGGVVLPPDERAN